MIILFYIESFRRIHEKIVKKWHIGECVIWPETSDFTYICKGYTYEMIKASLVYKGAFICSIIVRSISGYNNDFDELTGPVILLLLENLKKINSITITGL